MPETESAAPARPARVRAGILVVLAAVAVVVYAIDRATKYLVTTNLTPGRTVDFIGNVVQLHYVENSGAAFSLGSGTTWLFALIAAAVAIFIVIFARRIRSVAWSVLFGMLLGGTLGNLTDRLTRGDSFGQGHVIDFVQVIYFPAIFNIADSAIVASMGLFIILTLRGQGLDGRRARRGADRTDELQTPDSA